MNLREIIRESIGSVILDSIISEEIIKEAGSARKNMKKFSPNNRKQAYQPKKNLQQKKQQNVVQANQAAANKKQQNVAKKQQTAANREQRANDGRQERFNQWSNQWANKNLPQETPNSTQQGGYGYTNSGFDYAENGANANNTNTAQQTNQQTNQQTTPQPSADFSRYADELRKLVGNTGIDPKPVQNNQIAVQHINVLNNFVFAVINAIDNGNIDGVNSPAAGRNNSWNRYGEDNVDLARNGMRGAVNYASDKVNALGEFGENNPLKGVGNAFKQGYNDVNDMVTQQMNRQKYAGMYNDSLQNISGGGGLTYLMLNIHGYPSLQTQYNQINKQYNNIFSATPNVGNCYQVLQNLAAAVTTYENTKKQQQKTQQTQQQGGAGQTTQTTQGGAVKPEEPNQGDNENPEQGEKRGEETTEPVKQGEENGEEEDENLTAKYTQYADKLYSIDPGVLNNNGGKFDEIVENIKKENPKDPRIEIVQLVKLLSRFVIQSIYNNNELSFKYHMLSDKDNDTFIKVFPLWQENAKKDETLRNDTLWYTMRTLFDLYQEMTGRSSGGQMPQGDAGNSDQEKQGGEEQTPQDNTGESELSQNGSDDDKQNDINEKYSQHGDSIADMIKLDPYGNDIIGKLAENREKNYPEGKSQDEEWENTNRSIKSALLALSNMARWAVYNKDNPEHLGSIYSQYYGGLANLFNKDSVAKELGNIPIVKNTYYKVQDVYNDLKKDGYISGQQA